MAAIPSALYPAQTLVSDPNFPYGKARNVIISGDGQGFPYEEQIVNDWLGFHQALLVAAAITPSGDPDEVGTSDYLDAIRKLAAGAHIAEVRRISDTIEHIGPVAYYNGLYLIADRDTDTSILQSADLNQWFQNDGVAADLGGPFQIFDFAQSPTRIIATSDDGNTDSIAISTDGENWTLAAGNLPGTFTGGVTIAYHAANARFVACDNGSGRTAYSDDNSATAWTDNGVLDAGGVFNPVSNGTLLLCASGGKIYSSANGIAWTLRHTFTGAFTPNNIVWLENEWVAVAHDGATDTLIAVSDDGLTWTELTSGSPFLIEFAAGAGSVLYGLDTNSDPYRYYVSLDHGRSWFFVTESKATVDNNLYRVIATANRRLLTPGAQDALNTDIVVGNRVPDSTAAATFS